MLERLPNPFLFLSFYVGKQCENQDFAQRSTHPAQGGEVACFKVVGASSDAPPSMRGGGPMVVGWLTSYATKDVQGVYHHWKEFTREHSVGHVLVYSIHEEVNGI